MAYRIEYKKTVKETLENLVDFLTNPVSFEINYDLAQGNGNIENISFNYNTAQTETWELKYDATNNIFKVTGSVSGVQADAQIDIPYDNGIISFTIKQGDIAWQDGDIVTIDAKKGSANPMKILGKGWINSLSYNKAWIAGTYGFSISGDDVTDMVKNGFNKFTSFLTKYCGGSYEGYNGIGKYYNSNYIQCTSINSTSHSLSSNISLCLKLPLLPTNGNGKNIKNEFYVYDYTSDYYTNETNLYNVKFDYYNKQIIVYDEVIYDFTNEAKTSKDDTILSSIVITIDNENGLLNLYIDGELKVENLQNDKWKNFKGLFGKYVRNVYYLEGYYVYNRILSQDEIKAIVSNGGHPPKELQDFYISVVNNTGWQPYVILQNNKFGFTKIIGTEISWYPILNLHLTEQQFTPNTYTDEYIRFNENLDWYGTNPYSENYHYPYSFTKPKIFFGDYDDIIEKYWFVSDGENLLIAIKKYDPALVENPTYQIFYIGWGEGDTTYDLPFVLGWGGNNAYDISNGAFRFGLMYNDNTSFWDGTKWVNNYVVDGSLNGEWQSIINDNQSISVIRVNKYKDLGYNKVINYGSPKWLYMINFTEIQPETEVYIDGEKYVVIPDNHSIVPYNYLIKMEGE